jgi:hypothetical protein
MSAEQHRLSAALGASHGERSVRRSPLWLPDRFVSSRGHLVAGLRAHDKIRVFSEYDWKFLAARTSAPEARNF